MTAEDVAVMKKLAIVLGAAALLTGCGGLPYSDPYASPDLSQKTECERNGGYWHSTPAVCDYPRR
jgi:hypothetical protein